MMTDDVADLKPARRLFFDRRAAEQGLLPDGKTNGDLQGNPGPSAVFAPLLRP